MRDVETKQSIRASDVVVRQAAVCEVDALERLHWDSIRALGRNHYSVPQIEAIVAHLLTTDDLLVLVRDGTYLVAEHEGQLLGSGGWSVRDPRYFTSLQWPVRASSTQGCIVRRMFVHPYSARLGVGGLLLNKVENAIVSNNHLRAELHATLSGVAFYSRKGYQSLAEVLLDLPDGSRLPVLHMCKDLNTNAVFAKPRTAAVRLHSASASRPAEHAKA